MPEIRCQLTPSWEVLYRKSGPQVDIFLALEMYQIFLFHVS